MALLKAIGGRAQELGRNVANDDIILLALFDLPEIGIAQEVLEAEGVDGERILATIRTSGDQRKDPPEGLSFPPAYNETLGRAQGFAATLGDGTITPEHALLALIWDPTTMASGLLWRLGVRRERVVERLRDAGIPVPATRIPEQREVDIGDRVWFDREQTQWVVSYVGRHIPRGTHWGWNYEDDRAWVRGESGVDMAALVDEALSELAGS